MRLVALSVLALSFATAACGESASSDASSSDSSGGASSSSSSSGAGGGSGGAGATVCGLPSAENAQFCADDAASLDCSAVLPVHTANVCGVPLRSPSGDLARSANVKEYAGTGDPQVGCYAPSGYPPPAGAPAQVTMQGVAKIFSHGCESKALTIEVWTVQRTGGADDGMPGALVGAAVTTGADCEATGVPSDKDESCSTTTTGKPFLCTYSYPNVPTETELLVKTSGALWAPVYEYDLYIANAEVSGGVFTKDVVALAMDDYSVIPQVAIGTSIQSGHGALAGEVHDCGDVRLINAVVDVDVAHKRTTYFTSDEDHPLPVGTAKGTSDLGLYAVIDVAPGPVAIGAAGTLGGHVVTLGFQRVRVFPDAMTFVTFRGLRPYMLPAQ